MLRYTMTTEQNSEATSDLDENENVDIVGNKTLSSCTGATIEALVSTGTTHESPFSPTMSLQHTGSQIASEASEIAIDAGDGELEELRTNDGEVWERTEERKIEVKPEISSERDENHEIKVVNKDLQPETNAYQHDDPGRIISSAEVEKNLEILNKMDGAEPASSDSLKESKNISDDEDNQSTNSTSFVNVDLVAVGDLGNEAVNYDPTENMTTDYERNDSIDSNDSQQNSFRHPNEQFAGHTSDHEPSVTAQGLPHPNEQYAHYLPGNFSPDLPEGQPRRKILHHPLLTPLSKIPWNKMINVSNACDAIFNCKYSMRQVEDEVRRENMIMNSSDYMGYAAESAGGFERGGNQFCVGTPFEEDEEDGCAETDFVELGLECCSMLDNDEDEEEDGDGVLEKPEKEPKTMDSHQTNSQQGATNRGRGNSDTENETEPLISQSSHTRNNNPSTFANLLSPEQKAEIHWRNMKPSADMMLYRQFYEE